MAKGPGSTAVLTSKEHFGQQQQHATIKPTFDMDSGTDFFFIRLRKSAAESDYFGK